MLKKYPQIKLEQLEVFGRLRMTHLQIAEYYGVPTRSVTRLMGYSEAKQAYSRGRAETVVAVRQKQLQLALGGNITLLLHAGFHFADQEKDATLIPQTDLEPSRFSWDAEMKKRLAAAREEIGQADTG